MNRCVIYVNFAKGSVPRSESAKTDGVYQDYAFVRYDNPELEKKLEKEVKSDVDRFYRSRTLPADWPYSPAVFHIPGSDTTLPEEFAYTANIESRLANKLEDLHNPMAKVKNYLPDLRPGAKSFEEKHPEIDGYPITIKDFTDNPARFGFVDAKNNAKPYTPLTEVPSFKLSPIKIYPHDARYMNQKILYEGSRRISPNLIYHDYYHGGVYFPKERAERYMPYLAGVTIPVLSGLLHDDLRLLGKLEVPPGMQGISDFVTPVTDLANEYSVGPIGTSTLSGLALSALGHLALNKLYKERGVRSYRKEKEKRMLSKDKLY